MHGWGRTAGWVDECRQVSARAHTNSRFVCIRALACMAGGVQMDGSKSEARRAMAAQGWRGARVNEHAPAHGHDSLRACTCLHLRDRGGQAQGGWARLTVGAGACVRLHDSVGVGVVLVARVVPSCRCHRAAVVVVVVVVTVSSSSLSSFRWHGSCHRAVIVVDTVARWWWWYGGGIVFLPRWWWGVVAVVVSVVVVMVARHHCSGRVPLSTTWWWGGGAGNGALVVFVSWCWSCHGCIVVVELPMRVYPRVDPVVRGNGSVPGVGARVRVRARIPGVYPCSSLS